MCFWALTAFGLISPCKPWARSPSHLFLAAGRQHRVHPCRLDSTVGSTGTTRPPLSPLAAESALDMMRVSSCSQRKCSVTTNDLIQLVWGPLSLALLTPHCGGWRSTEECDHPAGAGATEHSGEAEALHPAGSEILLYPTPVPHEQQRHFWHSSGQLAGTHRDQRLACAPWLSSRSLSAGQARALCCELCDPREPAESRPKKCLSHPRICKAYKEQSYFSLIANYSSWQARLPPTFIPFEKNPIKSPFSAALQWADSISLVCLPNSHTSYQMLAPNSNSSSLSSAETSDWFLSQPGMSICEDVSNTF